MSGRCVALQTSCVHRLSEPVGIIFFFQQKTAYDMRISDWSSDVCSSDLLYARDQQRREADVDDLRSDEQGAQPGGVGAGCGDQRRGEVTDEHGAMPAIRSSRPPSMMPPAPTSRSEEHTSELQSLMRISYAVFCLKKKKKKEQMHRNTTHY